ncbi:MAG TPA: cytochrome b/b6 domain-containing protein [Sphingopyxis sp.]|nr:cytochrome b/b6 domain-containing protein [Sphingopyxis sp.]HMP44231.1 cytochrome b/b6 domain-containing protein [Sphingopyxis sp.]HMQ20435.1 cytochrome b/b6 domain-containing protein [Sphingopyxis sp.]
MSRPDDPSAHASDPPPPRRIYRHRLPVRLWHWVNAVTLLILLMSGLMIFNAHPRLYWGEYGANADHAWFAIGSTRDTGFVRIGATRIETTGVLGRWTDRDGVERTWAFPGWATIPTSYDLASGRRWHLFFAWVLAIGLTLFMLWTAFGEHLKKDLHIRRREWAPRHIWRDVKNHARLRFPRGEAAARYGILQKFAYIGVIFVLLPLMIFTGLAMSPGMNAAWPWLIDVFGGRQSARSIHFIGAGLLVIFFFVHFVMVLLSGPVNQLRAMLTGWFRLPPEKAE